MALTPTAAIPDALMTAVSAFADAQSPPLAVAFPDILFTPPVGVPYLDVAHLPNRTDTATIGDGGSQRLQGFLQVAVMWPAGDGGAILASNLAGQVLAHFAKGSRFSSDGTLVRIIRAGWVSPPLTEPDRLRVPVSIPYVAFSA